MKPPSAAVVPAADQLTPLNAVPTRLTVVPALVAFAPPPPTSSQRTAEPSSAPASTSRESGGAGMTVRAITSTVPASGRKKGLLASSAWAAPAALTGTSSKRYSPAAPVTAERLVPSGATSVTTTPERSAPTGKPAAAPAPSVTAPATAPREAARRSAGTGSVWSPSSSVTTMPATAPSS